MNGNIEIVIGSWGSYNACNDRAYGSSWLDLSNYDSWEEIEEELTKEGFELEGMDEELFIQDIEGIDGSGVSWDYIHPKTLFGRLQEAEVLKDSCKYDKMCAYLEVESLRDFFTLVDDKGSRWDDDIYLYPNYDWADYGREYFDMCCYKMDEHLKDFFDFEAYGKYIGDYETHEYSNGLIEIRY